MTGWQVQAMWEADTAAEWERQNAPDPEEGRLKSSAVSLKAALGNMCLGLDSLYEAVEVLTGTPMEDSVQSMIDGFEAMINVLESTKNKYERGVRE